MCTEVELFGVISWWSIWIVIGVGCCLFAFDKLCSVRKVTAGANKFYYFLGIIAIAVGFFFALLVQSIYDWIETGTWSLKDSGVTFMGGMYGGVICFVVLGLIFAKKDNRAQFAQVCEIGLTCIPIAHAFGRIGCFAAGCCYGAKVQEGDAFGFLGVVFKHGAGSGVERYPTQLFEAIFLFILAAVMIYCVVKNKKINSILYFGAYGIFRFLLEFLRDDYRGSIGTVTLSPSQVLSIVSVVISLAFLTLKILSHYKPNVGIKVLEFFKLNVAITQAEVVEIVESASDIEYVELSEAEGASTELVEISKEENKEQTQKKNEGN